MLLYFLGSHQIIQFKSYGSYFNLMHCNLNLIRREAEARSGGGGHRFAFFKLCYFSCAHVVFVLSIILKQTNYANSTQKQRIQQISNEFFCLLLCSLCIFDKSSKATGYASLSVICQEEMNGYSELYSGLLYPVPSEDDYRGRAGEAEVSNEGGKKI